MYNKSYKKFVRKTPLFEGLIKQAQIVLPEDSGWAANISACFAHLLRSTENISLMFWKSHAAFYAYECFKTRIWTDI